MINGKERKRNIILEKEVKITVENNETEMASFTAICLENNYNTQKIYAQEDYEIEDRKFEEELLRKSMEYKSQKENVQRNEEKINNRKENKPNERQPQQSKKDKFKITKFAVIFTVVIVVVGIWGVFIYKESPSYTILHTLPGSGSEPTPIGSGLKPKRPGPGSESTPAATGRPTEKSYHSKSDEIKIGYVFTNSQNNLNLRSEPSVTAKIISSIPNSTEVEVLKYDEKTIELNGEIGKWCKI